MKRSIKLLSIASILAGAFTLGTLSAPPQAEASSETIRFAYAGDSLTAGKASWMKQWNDPNIINVGGYAKSGNTAAQTLASIKPVQADVLVVMLGTNDARQGIAPATTAENIRKIAQKVGAPRVLVTFVPPSNISAEIRKRHYELNRYLTQYVYKQKNWGIADPWSQQRTQSGTWHAGTNVDNIHPNSGTSTAVMDRLERYIRHTFEGSI